MTVSSGGAVRSALVPRRVTVTVIGVYRQAPIFCQSEYKTLNTTIELDDKTTKEREKKEGKKLKERDN